MSGELMWRVVMLGVLSGVGFRFGWEVVGSVKLAVEHAAAQIFYRFWIRR